MEPEKSYKSLQKKFALPDWNELDKIFEVSMIEKDRFILREIRRKITEKLEHYIKILDGVMNPDTSVSCLHECRFFTDTEKKAIFDLYSELMTYVRNSDICGLVSDEKMDAEFISSVTSQWPKIQSRLYKILEKLKKSWMEKEVSEKDIIAYFG
ncbi:MAG: hypothetical protein QXK37_03405 [Candidatus Woesearchaeota archaeon]